LKTFKSLSAIPYACWKDLEAGFTEVISVVFSEKAKNETLNQLSAMAFSGKDRVKIILSDDIS